MNFSVIGNPVEHSISPLMHTKIFHQLNIKAEYNKTRLDIGELPNCLQKIRDGLLSGVNVTIPYKEKVIDLLDEINPRTKIIGSVNCISYSKGKLIGNNTDWYGFSNSLIRNNVDVFDKEVVILGAGGAAKSIIYSLEQLGVSKIQILNRTYRKAKRLEKSNVFSHSINDIKKIIKYNSIIVNTTSIGMKSDQTPIDFGLLNQKQTLIDVIYIPLETNFIKLGNKIGAKTLNGLDMFIDQGLASLDLWFGENISNQVNFKELKSYLRKQLC